MKHRFLAFGIKHELAIRWPLWDWYRSNKVARQINEEIADSSIYNLSMKNQPTSVGRLSGTEARFLGEFKKIASSDSLILLSLRSSRTGKKAKRD